MMTSQKNSPLFSLDDTKLHFLFRFPLPQPHETLQDGSFFLSFVKTSPPAPTREYVNDLRVGAEVEGMIALWRRGGVEEGEEAGEDPGLSKKAKTEAAEVLCEGEGSHPDGFLFTLFFPSWAQHRLGDKDPNFVSKDPNFAN